MKSQRFLVLDGMRGIAAFAVLWLHAGLGFASPFYPRHGYLAVDFFFALSGFVVAHAYEARIAAGLSFTGFAGIRLIRLYPMIFAGAVLGALAFNPGWSGTNITLAWLDASIFLVLPFGLLFHLSAFPVNSPVWSLFFEFCANAVYFFTARRPGRDAARTVILIAASAVVLAAVAHLVGGLSAVGFSSVASFLAGFPRVAVSFAIGVLIFRYRLHEHLPRVADFFPALALAALLAVPDCGWWYDMLCVLVAFPLLLCLGARASETPQLQGFWYWGGALSYPLYVIHEPALRAVFWLHGGGLAAVAVAVVLSWALLLCYDEPLRRRLGRRAAPAPSQG
jgi:peptidoglycan/LPS O-acetylase OafA/YrhL